MRYNNCELTAGNLPGLGEKGNDMNRFNGQVNTNCNCKPWKGLCWLIHMCTRYLQNARLTLVFKWFVLLGREVNYSDWLAKRNDWSVFGFWRNTIQKEKTIKTWRKKCSVKGGWLACSHWQRSMEKDPNACERQAEGLSYYEEYGGRSRICLKAHWNLLMAHLQTFYYRYNKFMVCGISFSFSTSQRCNRKGRWTANSEGPHLCRFHQAAHSDPWWHLLCCSLFLLLGISKILLVQKAWRQIVVVVCGGIPPSCCAGSGI